MNHELHSCSQRPLAPSNQTPPAYGHLPSDRGGVGSAVRDTPFLAVRRHIWTSLPCCTAILVGVLSKLLDS